jgi:hypothetical protein
VVGAVADLPAPISLIGLGLAGGGEYPPPLTVSVTPHFYRSERLGDKRRDPRLRRTIRPVIQSRLGACPRELGFFETAGKVSLSL